jgi:hypothetical protein
MLAIRMGGGAPSLNRFVRNEFLSNCGNSYITRPGSVNRRGDGKNDAKDSSDQLFADMDVF